MLIKRGMRIEDPDLAQHFLAHLNYYRLAAYWLPFEKDHASHQFKEETTFNKVLQLYTFDRELRLLIMDAIERIEIAVRARWAYELSHEYGPHAHLSETIMKDKNRFNQHMMQLKKELERSTEDFIKHMDETYKEETPPIWATCEAMSLGLLSRYYANLNARPIRKKISRPFAIEPSQLESWLHHLTIIRNNCAHHARIWNKEFAITPEKPRTRPNWLVSGWHDKSRRIFNTLLIILHFMDIISPLHSWREKLIQHLENHQLPGGLQAMGFPRDATLDSLKKA